MSAGRERAARFVAEARALLGTPWRHLGRNPAGVDCVGLLLLAGARAGLAVPDPPPYTRLPSGYALAEACAAIGRRVPLAEARPGDVLLFSDSLYPCHVGLRTERSGGVPHCLHARASSRAVVEEPLAFELADTLRRAYRHHALEG